MKILHVTPTYSPCLGGGEVHLQEISERMVARGHEVTVLTANVTNCWNLSACVHGDLPEIEDINSVKVVRFRPEGGRLGVRPRTRGHPDRGRRGGNRPAGVHRQERRGHTGKVRRLGDRPVVGFVGRQTTNKGIVVVSRR